MRAFILNYMYQCRRIYRGAYIPNLAICRVGTGKNHLKNDRDYKLTFAYDCNSATSKINSFVVYLTFTKEYVNLEVLKYSKSGVVSISVNRKI